MYQANWVIFGSLFLSCSISVSIHLSVSHILPISLQMTCHASLKRNEAHTAQADYTIIQYVRKGA